MIAAKVFIVDDDPAVLASLGRLVRSAGYAVETFESARALLRQAPADESGCIVLDLHMPDGDGLSAQAALRASGCTMPIVFLTGANDIGSCVKAMKAGASNYLTKPVDADALFPAIAEALAEHDALRERHERRLGMARRFAQLSPREKVVCRLVSTGMLNKQIAGRLGLAEKTVKVHRGQVMRKLGVRSVAELVRAVDSLDASPAHADVRVFQDLGVAAVAMKPLGPRSHGAVPGR